VLATWIVFIDVYENVVCASGVDFFLDKVGKTLLTNEISFHSVGKASHMFCGSNVSGSTN